MYVADVLVQRAGTGQPGDPFRPDLDGLTDERLDITEQDAATLPTAPNVLVARLWLPDAEALATVEADPRCAVLNSWEEVEDGG